MYEHDTIEQAAHWLTKGNLLAYPTESVWGIGCDAMNEEAVQRILTIKNRPIDKGLIVVTDSVERIAPLLTQLTQLQIDGMVASCHNYEAVIQHHQPTTRQLTKQQRIKQQATTWLLPIPDNVFVPHWITGQHTSVAVRVIAHPLIKKLCASMVSPHNPFGFIISTSCNPATHQPANNLNEAQAYFSHYDSVSYFLGETLGYELPSQIKNILTGDVIR